MSNSLFNLGIAQAMEEAIAQLGFRIEDVIEREPDAALGNGGLGRLAACFLDTMATLGYPGFGYGLYYEFGLFKQEIDNGCQREKPDRWVRGMLGGRGGPRRKEDRSTVRDTPSLRHDGSFKPVEGGPRA